MSMFRRAACWLLVAFVLPPAGAGCKGPEAPATASEAEGMAGSIPTVPVVRPERALLERSTTQPATVLADHSAEIHARVNGYLEELRVDIGDRVEAGQVLGVVDVPEMQKARQRQLATIARLEAEERRADSQVDLARAEVEASAAQLEQEQAQIATEQATLDAQRAEFNRVQGLVAEGAVTAQLLDEARERFESSRAALASAEAAVTTARANVDVAEAKVDASRAALEATRAETEVARKQLEELDAMLGFGVLKAPFDGIITRREVDPGDLVRDTQGTSGASAGPLFVVAKLDTVRVQVPLPEDDAPMADVGDPAAVRFRSLPQASIPGALSRIARSLDESTQTMLVEIDLPNPELRLFPGMYGEATVILERSEGLVLPAGAVRYDETGRSSVYVVSDDGVVHIVDISTGIDDGNRIQITSGLDGSERVVGPTIDRLQDGQRVRIAED